MKNTAFTVFKILCLAILTAKILNWFLDFSAQTNGLLNTIMFCLIGIAYLVFGFVWKNKWINSIFIICGLYLIIMNFIQKDVFLNIISFICILTPLLIGRFYKAEDDEKQLMKA